MKNKNKKKDKNLFKNKKFWLIICSIALLYFIGGIVYATTTIYNEYTKNLKNAGEIKSDELYRDYEGNYTYENKDNMQYDEETGFSYIIINNILDFTKYKEKLNELPEMKESDFEKYSLIIIVKYDWFNAYESNLKIYDITSDETTTYIELTQNENLNYNKINYIKEEDLLNVNNKSIFINTSLNYFELLYYYGKELICDYFDLNELNLKILITIINFLNHKEIYLFGKNKNIVKSELINNQIKYYEYSSSENLYIKICLQKM